jgi:hypothetical protein
MRRPNILISTAWTLQVLAWLLPVVEVIGVQLPGWQAFIATVGALWPGGNAGKGPWYETWLAGITALTTLGFVLGSPWVLLRGSPEVRRAVGWGAVAAFVFNAHWWVLGDLRWSELKIGYFFWWFSFAVLALGLLDLAGQRRVGLQSSAVTRGSAAP